MIEGHETTATKLKAMIAAGSLGADGRLPPERMLASDLGVSRRTIRRALEILESEGQVWRRQGAGTFVGSKEAKAAPNPFSQAIEQTNPVEVLEVRLTFEPTLARLAALRASKCDIDKLYELAEATRVAASPKAYEEADAAFHRRVALATRNALFLAIFDAVIASIERAAWHGVRENSHCSKNQARYASFHLEIAEAIANRNPDIAEERMFAHLSRVQESLLAATSPRIAALARAS